MKTAALFRRDTTGTSDGARQRMLGVRGEPLLYADWLRVVFIHFEVDAEALQRVVPFELDLWEGRAYLSLVAFTMRDMRPRMGGRFGALLFKPIATNNFLNVRAYVKHNREPGIYFLAEWMDNRFSVRLGPLLFGLPYRSGLLEYHHHHEAGELNGKVTGLERQSRSGFRQKATNFGGGLPTVATGDSRFEYAAEIDRRANFEPCAAGSLDEFLLERYTAFTLKNSAPRTLSAVASAKADPHSALFRIWHPPWPQTAVGTSLLDTSLLTKTWPWFADSQLISANYSPGIRNVWMGRPQKI